MTTLGKHFFFFLSSSSSSSSSSSLFFFFFFLTESIYYVVRVMIGYLRLSVKVRLHVKNNLLGIQQKQ